LFLTNGAVFANLLPRYPQIKADLGLSNAEYGLAIASFPSGALMAGLAAGALIRRFRSSRVAVAGTLLTSLGMLLAGLAPSWGRSPVRSSSRAAWTPSRTWRRTRTACGCSGSTAAQSSTRSTPSGVSEPWAAASWAVSPRASTCRVACIWASMGLCRIWLMMAALVLIAVGGTLVEDAGSTWAAVYLSGTLGADVGIASLGYIALVGAQFVGRLLGDGLVDRFGQRAVARTGGATTAVGMGAALLFPSLPGSIAGFALAGFGVATLVPAAMHGADELPGLRAGTGLTLLSWLMRLGLLVSPPIVGLVADAVGLRVGLLVVPLAGALVLALAGVLSAARVPAAGVHRG